MSTSEVEQYPTSPKPDPTTLDEALARQNTTPEAAWDLAVQAKWGFVPEGDESPYEYDQGDTLTVEYDNLYDLADIALAAMKLAGGGPADPVRDGRCEDYDNDPTKSYHAHDTPRCKDQGVEWFEGRWLCRRHIERRDRPAIIADAEDTCDCGDYRYQHDEWVGPCNVCKDKTQPWDGCQRFVLHQRKEMV